MIRILIAEAQNLVRVGLRHMLERQPHFEVVGEAATRSELFEQLAAQRPQVLIIDHKRPDAFGAEDVRRAKAEYPGTHILVISADEERPSVQGVLQNGVSSFLTKECDEEEVLNAVKATAKGERFICHKVIDLLLEREAGQDLPIGQDSACEATVLSEREREILQLVAQGLTAKSIGERLFLSTHTIYTHRKNILKKLKASSTADLVKYAVKAGLVER